MDTSRLQYPESSPTAVSAGQFAGYSSDGFKLVNDQYIQFQISDAIGTRSELRHYPEWSSSSSIERSIVANLMMPPLDPAVVQEFTFLQVHTKEFLGNPSGPLLRLVWKASRSGLSDWLWANLRTSLNPKSNSNIELLPRPTGFFDIEVRLVNSTLSILIDGVPLPSFDESDLSYWDSIQTNYFKAGAYLNSGTGTVTTLFDEINFTV